MSIPSPSSAVTGRANLRRLLIYPLAILLLGLPPLVPQSRAYTQADLQTAEDGTIETIPLEAAVSEAPPQIAIKTYAAGTFNIYRKPPGSTTWGTAVATGVALPAEGTWTDTQVSAGTLYEYRFENTAAAALGAYPSGYILCGIRVDQTEPKGRLALVVASDVMENIPAEYGQYKKDLERDGWVVHEIPCPRAPNYNGAAMGAIATLNVSQGGSGYIQNDLVALSNASGSTAIAKLTTTNGILTGSTCVLLYGGQGFKPGEALVMSRQKTGSGAVLTAVPDPSSPMLASVDYNYRGTGYTNGETVTITGSTSGATAQCMIQTDNSAGDGRLGSLRVLSSGTGFVNGESLSLSGNSTGSGVERLSPSTFAGSLSAISISSFASGYTDGETVTLTGTTSGKTAQATLWSYPASPYFEVTSSDSGFVPGEFLVVSGSSGNGFSPTRVKTIKAGLQSVNVLNGGSGYVDGDTVTLGGGQSPGTGILSVSGGAITGVTVTSGGSGFQSGVYVSLGELQPMGSGASVSVVTVDNSGAAVTATLTGGGSGYTDNDTAIITGTWSGKTASASLIAPSGTVTGISAVLPNSFTPGEPLTLTASSGGAGAAATASTANQVHLLIREKLQALYNAYPGELKGVVMIGKVPLVRSGLNDWVSFDGHGNKCAYGTDAFYADMDGVLGEGGWTDTGSNSAVEETTLESGGSIIPEQHNLPGDGKFDQDWMEKIGNGKVELGFGRIDLSMGFAMEWEALKVYFDKLHRYKSASRDFQPGRKACNRRLFANVAESCLQSMPSVVGMNNIDFVPETSLPRVETGRDPDQVYSAENGPYLFYFKGSKPPLDGDGGRAVFWTGMQSHYGYWYWLGGLTSNSNGMQRHLAGNNFTLSWTWSIMGIRYNYHRLGMGLDMADMMRQSINNGYYEPHNTYNYKYDGPQNIVGRGSLVMNHMGDPALRLFMFAPPSRLSIVKNGANPSLSWIPSPDPTVSGYHVYRRAAGNGPYTRLTAAPQPETTYLDTSAPQGIQTYMVRAVRLETTGSGTYLNPSLGTEQTIDLAGEPDSLAVTSTVLPPGNWNTAYSQTLSAVGGYPQYQWSLASGELPAGLSLSPEGVLSGNPAAAGDFTFTAGVADQANSTAQKTLTLHIGFNQQNIVYPEASAYTDKSTATTNYGTTETTLISGIPNYMYETFQRYNLSAVPLNNGFVKATLRLPVAAGANCLVQANLVADGQDAWVETPRSSGISAYANNGSGQVRITSPGHGFVTGNPVAITGFSPGNANGLWSLVKIDDDHFDIPVAYSSGWTIGSTATATSSAVVYNNRPNSYNTSVPTLSVSGVPVANSILEMDVTDFVTETLRNDPAKLLSIRLFTASPATATLASRRSYGSAIPSLLIETSDAPAISVQSPADSRAFIYAGSTISLAATVTALPSRANSLVVGWSKVSGPGIVTFSSPWTASTGASFPIAGDYVIRLTASDGALQSTRDITVRVLDTPVLGPTGNLTLHLPFSEGAGVQALDASGNSNHAAVASGAGWGTGKWDSALSCDASRAVKSITGYANNGSGQVRLTCPGHGLQSGMMVSISGLSSLNANPRIVTRVDNDTIDLPAISYTAGTTLTAATATYALSYARIEHATTLDNNQKMSISVWINPSTKDATIRHILRKYYTSNADSSYGFSVNNGVVTAYAGNLSVAGTRVLGTGQWSHLVLVFDGSLAADNARLYINGSPEKFSQLALGAIPHKPGSPLWIGVLHGADANGFKGLVDGVRVYQGKALTQDEVLDLYAGSPSNMAPQVSVPSTLSGHTGEAVELAGTATDDGLPAPVGLAWSKVAGPGTVGFDNPGAVSTTATFSAAGIYTLRLTASDGALAAWAETAVTISGMASGYDQWAASHGLSGQDALDGASPAGDGITNLVKYALGLDPHQWCGTPTDGINPGLPAGRLQDNWLSLTYQKDTAKTDVVYTPEISTNLLTWSSEGITLSTERTNGTIETVKASAAVGDDTKKFIRLRISK